MFRGLQKLWGSIKIEVPSQSKNGDEYLNEGLATIGDTILKSVIADKFYREGITTKGEITIRKSNIEKNVIMHKIMIEKGLIDYAYNNLHFYKDPNIPDNEQVVHKEHDPYIEAMVGAVYYDSGNYETTKSWILKWLIPLLELYK